MHFVKSKITLTLVVLMSLSLFLLTALVITTGTALISRGKCGSPFTNLTLTELSVSNLRHVFTLK